VNAVAGHHVLQRLGAFEDDARVFPVEEDAEAKDATGMRGDASVSQIQTE
jgi:hypothetical protein